MRVVSNAGPLIHLSWIGRLDLLPSLFDEVLVPLAVRDEVMRARPGTPGLADLQEAFVAPWLISSPVGDQTAVAALRPTLDRGESEAIVLVGEADADLLLLDDRHARAVAQRQALPIAGTIGILRLARERGLVPAVLPLLQDLRLRGFRVSSDLVAQIEREEQTQ